MRKVLVVLLMIIFPLPAFAQKVADKKFLGASVFLTSATLLDVETTFVGLIKCNNCREGNSFMRPLIKSGRPLVYTVQGTVDASLIAWSYKLKRGGNKLWWLPPVIVGATHATAGGFNLRFVF